MKKTNYKVTVFLLAVVAAMVITILPVKKANAATTEEMWDKYMTEAMDDLYQHLGGKYFTENAMPCNPNGKHSSCDGTTKFNCNVSYVIKADWFKTCFSDRSYVASYSWTCFPKHQYTTALSRGGWTCFGFAGFGQYYIYDYLNHKFLSTSVGNIQEDGKAVANGSFTAEFCKANVKVGDILRLQKTKGSTDGHSVIVYKVLDNGIEVIDNNWGATTYGSSYTQKHTISYSTNGGYYAYVYVCRPVNTRAKLLNVISTSTLATSVPNNVKVNESNGKITITWDAVDNAKCYALYMKDVSGNVTLVHNRITANTYSCTVQPNGQTLGFVVKAYANKEWGGYSKTGWVTVTSSVRPPSTVTVTPGAGSATVTWELVPGAQVYALFMKDANGVVTLVHNRVTTNSYTVNGLTAGKSVGFVVKAYVNRQWSGWSGTTWTKPLAGTAKVYGTLDLSGTGYTSYNVGLNVEMYADKAYPLTNGAVLEILGKYTNSKGNEIYHVYSTDLGRECYVTAKYVKVN